MAWFRKKKIFVVHYKVLNYTERYVIVKAKDIEKAAQKCQETEVFPISILGWKIIDDQYT
jgi:hypothetical protein